MFDLMAHSLKSSICLLCICIQRLWVRGGVPVGGASGDQRTARNSSLLPPCGTWVKLMPSGVVVSSHAVPSCWAYWLNLRFVLLSPFVCDVTVWDRVSVEPRLASSLWLSCLSLLSTEIIGTHHHGWFLLGFNPCSTLEFDMTKWSEGSSHSAPHTSFT